MCIMEKLDSDSCEVQIDWFHWYMSNVCELKLWNIKYVTIINKIDK